MNGEIIVLIIIKNNIILMLPLNSVTYEIQFNFSTIRTRLRIFKMNYPITII